jgi:hypothetical protein
MTIKTGKCNKCTICNEIKNLTKKLSHQDWRIIRDETYWQMSDITNDICQKRQILLNHVRYYINPNPIITN